MKLEQIRKEKGISQSQLAIKMNVTQGAVSQWENGQVKPRADTLTNATLLGEAEKGRKINRKEG